MESPPQNRPKIILNIKPQDPSGGSMDVVNIDPHGDVLIEAGLLGENILIRVSSKVLREASRVFAAMLGPNFKEGQDLQSDSSTPKPLVPISLRDDGKTPLTILLQFIHGHTGFSMNTEQFAAVSSLVHKYDFAKAAKSWTKSQLLSWASGAPEWPELLVSAYECDDAEIFHKASREIMFRYGKEKIKTFNDAVLPGGLLEALGLASFHLCNGLSTQIALAYNRFYSLQRASSLSHNDLQCTAVARIGAMATQMHELGMSGMSWGGGCCDDISKVVLRLEQAELASENSPCSCECCKFDMKSHLLDTITRYEQAEVNKGVCLTCVKAGKYTIQHYEPAHKRNCSLKDHKEIGEESMRTCLLCRHDISEVKPKSHEGGTKDGPSCLESVFNPRQQSPSLFD